MAMKSAARECWEKWGRDRYYVLLPMKRTAPGNLKEAGSLYNQPTQHHFAVVTLLQVHWHWGYKWFRHQACYITQIKRRIKQKMIQCTYRSFRTSVTHAVHIFICNPIHVGTLRTILHLNFCSENPNTDANYFHYILETLKTEAIFL